MLFILANMHIMAIKFSYYCYYVCTLTDLTRFHRFKCRTSITDFKSDNL